MSQDPNKFDPEFRKHLMDFIKKMEEDLERAEQELDEVLRVYEPIKFDGKIKGQILVCKN